MPVLLQSFLPASTLELTVCFSLFVVIHFTLNTISSTPGRRCGTRVTLDYRSWHIIRITSTSRSSPRSINNTTRPYQPFASVTVLD
jgi:hypothetical protein